MADDYVTGAEFGRWRLDFNSFQDRLETHLRASDVERQAGFTGVHERLDELNGRTRKNSEALVALDGQVANVQARGCGQIAEHQKTLLAISQAPAVTTEEPPWHKNKNTWLGMGGGATIAAILYELVRIGAKALGLA